MAHEKRPYGLWDSPIGVEHLSGAVALQSVTWDSATETLVWLERCGAESVILCRDAGEIATRQLTTGVSVCAKVLYGGGELGVGCGTLYYIEGGERVVRQTLTPGGPTPLTEARGCPAAPTPSPDGRWLLYVFHEDGEDQLRMVDTAGSLQSISLTTGADFYLHPCWHPEGNRIAWIEWDFPNMPWDGTRLMLSQLIVEGVSPPRLESSKCLAGGNEVTIFQPEFSPDGRYLAYASDEAGWSQLWLHDLASGEMRCLTDDDKGDIAQPPWVQGQRSFAFAPNGERIYYTRSHEARRRAWVVDTAGGPSRPVQGLAQYTAVNHLAATNDGVAAIASASGIPNRLVIADDEGGITVHARSTGETIPGTAFSVPEPISWRAEDGTKIRGLYYPPASEHFEAAGPPPMIVEVHGGPTGESEDSFEIEIQYFATRGWARLLVNYRGSTGYGRAYRNALRGQYGITDVEDAVSGTRFCVDSGRADGNRLAIVGSSSGGYTVLQVLTLHPGLFRAAICKYGISDLLALTEQTHKFETRYFDHLVGPLPETESRYRERSPIHKLDSIRDPVAVFQGTNDGVVPQTQSDALVGSLRERNIPHEYHLYEGEGHGFRQPKTVAHFTHSVEAFLGERVLLE
ncbi:MAG: S9 family peptidase [Candidatus Latescibacterota bacterium]|nr:S9 family peptidase [Candidatus Latescibacterota bacterium]